MRATVKIDIDWDTANLVVLALDLLIGAYDKASAADLAKPYRSGTGDHYWHARAAINHFSNAAADAGAAEMRRQGLE